MNDERVIAEALGKILGRAFRGRLYSDLTHGIAEGLNESTYPVLSAVARADGSPSARDIALEVGTDRSVVSRRAATLAAAGLIDTVGGPDRRAVYYALTSLGTEATTVMRRRLDAVIAEHIGDWAQDDISRFARLLTTFSEKPL